MDPTQSQYSDQITQVTHHVNSLPYTGSDLIALIAIAIFLVAFGCLCYRESKGRA